jgi:hypothetical protein
MQEACALLSTFSLPGGQTQVTAHFLVDQKLCRLRRRIHEEEDTCKYPAVINTHTQYPPHFGKRRSAGDDCRRACCVPDTHERGHSATHPSTPSATHPSGQACSRNGSPFFAPELRERFFWRELGLERVGLSFVESWGLRELCFGESWGLERVGLSTFYFFGLC